MRKLVTSKGKIAVALTILLLAPPFVQPAAARQPQIENTVIQFSFEEEFCGLQLLVEINAKVRATTFFDPAGEPERFQAIIRVENTLTNLDNAKFLIEREAYKESFDLPNPEGFTRVGLSWRFKLPHGGTVAFDAGKIVFDANGDIIYQAGPHPFDSGDPQVWQEVCVALQ